MQESKEKIRSRMIKNASRLWGFQDTQAESSFDPFIGMILGALASELSKISNDINTTESRVLEKLVELLTPEPITGPFPAHALLRANSVEPEFFIDSFYQFYVNKRFVIPGEHSADEKPVFFTPAGNYKLFNGQIKILATGSKIFEFQEELYKEIIASARPNQSLKDSEIWIGLEMHEDVRSINGMSICFDLRNEAFEESFYDSLAKGKWEINGQSLRFIQGFGEENIIDGHSLESLLQKELDVSKKVCSHINRFYRKQFITLTESGYKLPKDFSKNNIPPRIEKVFLSSDLKNLNTNLVWIKVEFPQIIPPEVLDDLFCSINCFPAYNRHLNEFTQSSRDFINIIPLTAEEAFLDMKKVTSSIGKTYTIKSFAGINEVENGTYIVRHGGVGRFDSRNAAEVLNYLLELLRDESAAFSIIGADMISSDIKELNQTISRLEKRLKESNIIKEDISYLLLKAHPKDEILFIEFWTTNGEFANKIKSGEKLFVYEGSDLAPDSVTFITPTIGGHESMDTDERVNAYRKALLSHGRVVTPEDIKALCFEHFGKLLEKVEIKKGIQTGQSTDSGFIRTLDIFLTLAKACEEIDEDELLFLKKDLLIKLEEQSANVLPYRIIVDKKNNTQK